jgi:hypothetical protein
MFGLMKRGPRLSYCGTCKTLGAVYGHATRVFLNHDTAFLAEVLLDLGGASPSSPAYRSFNCLTLPRTDQEIPVALRYAAAITVALAYFRVADHRLDAATPGRRLQWELAARGLRRPYRRAAQQLRSLGFPLDDLAAILAEQAPREAHPQTPAQVAEPTMQATALVFSHGVRLAGSPERAAAAATLGSRFGELIYFLDAFEDRERDRATGNFNPFLAFPLRYPDMAGARREILSMAADLESQMAPAHATRLRANVEERLGLRMRVLQSPHCRTFRDRACDALAFARSLRQRENAGWLKGASILATVAVLAFAFPEHARRADSWRQCLGVSMNLMALGAVFATPPPAGPPPGGPQPFHPDAPVAGVSSCRSCFCDMCAEGCTEAVCSSACG